MVNSKKNENRHMIRTELYFDFRIIAREDFSEQIKFYEKYRVLINKEAGFNEIKSRQEFLRRIFVLYYCGIAFSRTYNYEKSIRIFDMIIEKIREKEVALNIDLKKENYYINSIFEKGKAQYNLKKYYKSELTFKEILDTGFANHLHAKWYTYSRNARLFDNLNNWILYLIIFLFVFPKIAFSLSSTQSSSIGIINLVLFILYLFNPSDKISTFFTNKNYKKFNQQLNDKENDIEYYSEKIKQNPNDYVALTERGISYNLEDDFENSLKDLNAALEININNPDGLYYRAIAFSNLERYEEAINDLNKSIELNEFDMAELYHNRGYNYMMLKNYESALLDFNKALELEPYYASYRHDRGYILQEIGKNKEAIEDYDLVIKLEPENFTAITNRGEAHYALGDKEKALIDFKTAKEFGYKEAIENLEKLDFK